MMVFLRRFGTVCGGSPPLRNVAVRRLCTAGKTQVTEVRIPVPWGFVAGKWWGATDKRPILGLHGWRDNCGTYDPLAPMLAEDIGFLAIDWPGHGLSSHYPPGLNYQVHDAISLLKRIQAFFNWDKISLLAHSMGCTHSHIFAALYPDDADFVIAIDVLKPYSVSPENIIKNMALTVDHVLACERKTDPTDYAYDELLQMVTKGNIFSSLTPAQMPLLLKRGITPSKRAPGKFNISCDARFKVGGIPEFPHSFVLSLAERIKCPVLSIKASSSTYFEKSTFFFDVVDILRQSSAAFTKVVVEGHHHVHLQHPERVIEPIREFIRRHDKADRSVGGIVGEIIHDTN